MQEKVSVNLNIAGRKYPISALIDDEELLRKAEKMINDRINFHLKDKKIYDRQDLVSMVLVEFVFENLKLEDGNRGLLKALNGKLNSIEKYLN
jgi:cell division protein ZapA (FtsZ GTPase activity inhibitor)